MSFWCLCSVHAQGAPSHLLEVDLLFVSFCTKELLEVQSILQVTRANHQAQSVQPGNAKEI